MGTFWKSLLAVSTALFFSCSQSPSSFLYQNFQTLYVLTEEGYWPLGGWKELDQRETQILPSPGVFLSINEGILTETWDGVGLVSFHGEGLVWERAAWNPGFKGIRGLWSTDRVFFTAAEPQQALYFWKSGSQPEKVLIPTVLGTPDARLVSALPVGEEWLLQWSSPRAVWTLFHPKVGLERELPAEELRALRNQATQPSGELPPDWTDMAPSERTWTLNLEDSKLPFGRAVFTKAGGPLYFGLFYRDKHWVLSPSGTIRGSSGTGEILVHPGMRFTGLGAISEGLVAFWTRTVSGGRGHEGCVFLPWSIFEKSAILGE